MDEQWALRCIGVAYLGGRDHMVGQYLKAFDPDMYDGRGWTEWTDDLRFARLFARSIDALDFWRQESTVKPVRDDGKPNRPLTSYSIELVRLDG